MSSRSQLHGPETLPTGIRIGTRQFGQGDAHAGRDQGDEDDAVDDEDGAPGIDAGDQCGRDAEPRVREGEAHAQDGKDGKVSLHVLGVAHFGQFEGIGIEVIQMIRRVFDSHYPYAINVLRAVMAWHRLCHVRGWSCLASDLVYYALVSFALFSFVGMN